MTQAVARVVLNECAQCSDGTDPGAFEAEPSSVELREKVNPSSNFSSREMYKFQKCGSGSQMYLDQYAYSLYMLI